MAIIFISNKIPRHFFFIGEISTKNHRKKNNGSGSTLISQIHIK